LGNFGVLKEERKSNLVHCTWWTIGAVMKDQLENSLHLQRPMALAYIS
jgi:hypothetical protein